MEEPEDDVTETIVLSSPEDIKPVVDQPADDNTVITSIPESSPAGPEGGRKAPASDFEDMEATVVLQQSALPEGPSDFEDVQETVVLNAAPNAPGKPDQTTEQEPKSEFEDIEQTVVLSTDASSQPAPSHSVDGGLFDADDDLDKTVVIPPKK